MRCVPLAVRTAFAIFRLLVQRWWRRRSGTPYGRRTAAQHNMHAARFVPHRKELHREQFGMSRTGLAPATAMPALAALAMHTNTCTRAENA